MKRSEAIEEIVKKSYSARAKALMEAKKGEPFSPDKTVPGAPSTAAATASAPAAGASGASPGGGGGGNSTVRVKVRALKKLKNLLVVGDRVLGRPSEIKDGRLDGLISVIARDDAAADVAIADDPQLIDLDLRDIEPVEFQDVVLEVDPFGEGNGEEFALRADPGIADVVVLNDDGSAEQIYAEDDKPVEAYNVYEVLAADPGPADLRLEVQNNERIIPFILG
jgi:hypothetical protein